MVPYSMGNLFIEYGFSLSIGAYAYEDWKK